MHERSQARRKKSVSDAEARQGVDLGERAEHGDATAPPEVLETVRILRVGHVLEVGFVEDRKNMAGNAAEVFIQGALHDDRAGRIVGIGKVDQPRSIGDRGQHRLGIVKEAFARRLHQSPAGDPHCDREHDERGVRHDRLVPRPQVNPAEDVDQVVRARADRDPVGRNVPVGAQRFT